MQADLNLVAGCKCPFSDVRAHMVGVCWTFCCTNHACFGQLALISDASDISDNERQILVRPKGINPFMPNGLYYLTSLGLSIFNNRGVWLVFIGSMSSRNSYI